MLRKTLLLSGLTLSISIPLLLKVLLLQLQLQLQLKLKLLLLKLLVASFSRPCLATNETNNDWRVTDNTRYVLHCKLQFANSILLAQLLLIEQYLYLSLTANFRDQLIRQSTSKTYRLLFYCCFSPKTQSSSLLRLMVQTNRHVCVFG